MNPRNENPPISGIHHITAVAASAAENYRFYSRVLGLRMVKKTVNFDDPFTYHLYYGDETGRPGTILTFFPWEQAARGRSGTGMVSAIAFAVPRSSIDFWRRRLGETGITVDTTRRFGEPVVHFHDPHGLHLELIGTPTEAGTDGDAPNSETAITGFHSATMLLGRIEATQALLVEGMGMTLVRQEAGRYRFSMAAADGPGGNEHDLIPPLARRISPAAAIISPRGRVLENGMPRFFKRLAEGVFDETDVRRNAHHLSDFIGSASRRYGQADNNRIALGYSNGANMAAAIMLLRPEVFSAAILFRPMMPLKMARLPDLTCKSIFIATGRFDRVIPSAETRRLVHALKKAGATVKVVDAAAGHELTAATVEAARAWMSQGKWQQCTAAPSRTRDAA